VHTRAAFDVATLPLIVRWAEDELLKLRADAMLVCGHSGLLVAGALSYSTRIPVIAVRKKYEDTVAHSGPITAVLPNGKAKRWVWLDDFTGSGGTLLHATRTAWERELLENPYPVAFLEYNALKDKSCTVLFDEAEPCTWDTNDRYRRLRSVEPEFNWKDAKSQMIGFREETHNPWQF
jgi:hypothetical protein